MRRLVLLTLFSVLLPFPVCGQYDPVLITFLNVGQGDAVFVRAPGGETALIDAGPGVDVASLLGRLGVERLDLVVASHPHADHIGGMSQVLRSFPVRYYMDNGQPYTTATYHAVMQALQRNPGITYLEAVPRTIQLGSVNIHVLPMPPKPGSNPNNSSVGLVVQYGEFKAFLSGDSERRELRHFVQSGSVPDVTLLKAPHHGSDDAVEEQFLIAANPEVIVISVGSNSYGHPKPSAVYRYNQQADQLLRTDMHGEVRVSGFEDGRYEIALGESVVADGVGRPSERPLVVRPPMERPPVRRQLAERTDSGIAISVFADAPGNDHQNPNGEYAILTNGSSTAFDITGWTLCDAARHCFTFPRTTGLGVDGQVVVYTGSGRSDGVRFFMGSGQAVWNNRGDTATLYNAAGRVVATHVY